MALRNNSLYLRGLFVAMVFLSGMTKAQAEFRCGNNVFTYGVVAPDGSPARGVRCVKFVDRRSFAWYGEGQRGGAIYRHLGYAIGPLEVITAEANIFTGTAADFTGNGETTSGNFPGGLRISIPNPPAQPAWDENRAPNRIVVGGAWNESWVLRPDGVVFDWDPLGPVNRCGPFMSQFSVSLGTDDDDTRVHIFDSDSGGIRCSLAADGKDPAAWYGEGRWGGGAYRHIGTAFFGFFGPRWGAADICQPASGPRPGAGMFCGSLPFGSLNLRITNGGRSIRVSGSWNEWWDR